MGNRIFQKSNFTKAFRYLKKNGIRHACYAAKERIEEERKSDYRYREPSAEELEAQRRETAEYSELFSIVVPAFETREDFLREMIGSVRRQSYGGWELVIADAGSSDAVERVVKGIADEMAQGNECGCIRYLRLAGNKGISENTNAGIDAAEGDYIALLDHDDFLAPDALYHMAKAIHDAGWRGISPALIYTDEDKYEYGDVNKSNHNNSNGNGHENADKGMSVDRNKKARENKNRTEYNVGYYTSPHRKEKFNLDLILSNNYVCHFMAVKAELMKSLRLRKDFDGAQDYDLTLRVAGRLLREVPAQELPGQMIHIPRILYHWRCHAGSTAENTASKSYAYEAGKAALMQFCSGQGWRVEVRHALHLGFYDIDYLPDILAVRKDIGIVGGRILDFHNRICAGALDEKGNCMYEGLHKEYSGGSTHRAALKQDVAAVDIRFMQIRPELRKEFEQVTGCRYAERTVRCKIGKRNKEIRIADISGITCDEVGYRKLSMELGRVAAERGYLVLWNPKMSIRDGK